VYRCTLRCGEASCEPGFDLLAAGAAPTAVYVVTHGVFTVFGADGKPTGVTLLPGMGLHSSTFRLKRKHLLWDTLGRASFVFQ